MTENIYSIGGYECYACVSPGYLFLPFAMRVMMGVGEGDARRVRGVDDAEVRKRSREKEEKENQCQAQR